MQTAGLLPVGRMVPMVVGAADVTVPLTEVVTSSLEEAEEEVTGKMEKLPDSSPVAVGTAVEVAFPLVAVAVGKLVALDEDPGT